MRASSMSAMTFTCHPVLSEAQYWSRGKTTDSYGVEIPIAYANFTKNKTIWF